MIGLGYVGLPLAVAFAKKADVIGFDLDKAKIDLYYNGIDPTRECGDDVIKSTSVTFTSNEAILRDAKFIIVAVPTPINQDKTPNLNSVINVSTFIGRNLQPGAYVVYESTVYPGVTEDICIPILEKVSGMRCGLDFKVGYSPERINPGDKIHRLENITKIVSGMDEESLNIITKVYELVIEAGVNKASSIKVAEAVKVVENSQRDINIAFMNELAMIFDRMGIDTNEVVEAMNTKWNALGFYPGLVGGHCISVDPYYFVYQAEMLGYHSQIVLPSRKINDGMGHFIADAVIKKLVLTGKVVRNAKVAILGITFKENCPDIRNSKVEDIIKRLWEYGISTVVSDPEADFEETKREYRVELIPIDAIKDIDCIVFAVAHNEYKRLNWEQIDNMFRACDSGQKIIIDVRSILNKRETEAKGYCYWRL